MKVLTWAGGLLGLILLVGLGLHADLAAMAQALRVAGWPLLILVPWHFVFLMLYAVGWRALLAQRDAAGQAGTAYLLWATWVREGVDRLLPLPTIGGGLLGVRLLGWRGVSAAVAGASVLAEMLMTLAATYVFVGIGLYLLHGTRPDAQNNRQALALFALALLMPVGTFALLHSGSVLSRLQTLLHRWQPALAAGAARLDDELRVMLRATAPLALSAGLQLLGMVTGALEVWLALRLFGHPVGAAAALILESLTLGIRSIAFFIPAGIGAQEAGLVMFGHALGISPELSLAVSMVKRIREVACGVPALLSWHYAEGRRAQPAQYLK